jgi:hypothetical protein
MPPNPLAAPHDDSANQSLSRLEQAVEFLLDPIVLLTIVHLSILALGLPLLARLPGWFPRLQYKPLGPWYLLLGLAAVPLLAWLLARALSGHRFASIFVLILAGFAVQQGFAWSEGNGFDGIRRSVVSSGHAEFVGVAVQQPSMWNVVVEYEERLQSEELGIYAHSKPPGTLLFYMVTERLARSFARNETTDARLKATRNFAAAVWPMMAYLPLLPLYYTLRRFVDETTAYVACLLYLVVPSVTLMTLHTDECLFPLLFMSTTWMAVETQTRRSVIWAFVTGACLYLSAFFTFALLLAIPLAVAFAVATELQARPGPNAGSSRLALVKTGVAAAVGFILVGLVFFAAFNYDFFSRLEAATLYHAGWRQWRGGAFETFYFAWLDYLEFAIWIGVPFTLLALAGERRAILQAVTGNVRGLVLPFLVVLLSFLYLGFFGKTKAESGRLWLFLVPMCCALAAVELRSRCSGRWSALTAIVVGLQWLTVFLTKMGQDFLSAQ